MKRNKTEIVEENQNLVPVISWNTPQYIYFEKGPIWKVIAIIFILMLFAYGVFSSAWTFSLVILVAAIVYYIISMEEPKIITVSILESGIKVASKLYSFTQIKEFWIIHSSQHITTLHFIVKGDLIGEIKLPLTSQSATFVKEFLITKIPEVKNKKESMFDIISRLLKL